jgi:hypothetical protein
MRKVIVVYGGGFQPFHQGHMSSYEEAKRAFPSADFYVASSNDTKVRPIPFTDKKFLAQQAGVKDDFVQVKQPVNPEEILRKYDPEKDILILVRSERDPVNYTKKDGSPAYYQPFKNLKDCKPFDPKTGHGYIFVTKKKDFSVAGEVVYSGSQVRKMYSEADDTNREKIVGDLYPKATNPKKVKKLLDKYIGGLKEELEMDEALSLQGRRKRAMQVRRLKAKMLRARERAMRRFANQPTLTKRARRQAVTFLKRRIGGGRAYANLSPSQKISIDKKIDKMKSVVGKIGSRLLPQVRRAEIQRKQNQARTNESFVALFEKPELPQDKHVGGKEGTQPSKYYKGLDKGTKERRDAHFKRMGPKSDSDKSAYADAPGDKEAREKGMPQSKHTLKFKQMFGEEIGKKEISRLDQLVRLGLADKTLLSTIKKAMSKIDAGDTLSTSERQATQNLLSTLLDMVTSQDQLFNLAKMSLRKEEFDELNEAAYVGNIGIMELAKFYQKADPRQVDMFKKLLNMKDYKRAWALVQGVTGTKLVGKEFSEEVQAIVEKGEYDDYEELDGLEMAQIEVANLIQDAEMLADILSEMDEEPEAWVLSKITKAVDYIEAVTDYLEFEDDYDYDDEEGDDVYDDEDAEFEMSDTDMYEALSDMSKEEMGEDLYEVYSALHEEIEGLKKKAEKSGIAYSILKKVYDRGMAAWQGGHRPGTTPQQWAFARVNSFITKGKGTWGGADKDLASKAGDKNEAFSEFAETLEWGTDELRKKYAEDTPGQPTSVTLADHLKGDLNDLFQQNLEKIKRAHEVKEDTDVHSAIDWHTDNKIPLTENVFRVGSKMYFELYREARKLYKEGKLELQGMDKSLIEDTDIGTFAFTEEGQPVPLDCPMIAEEEEKDIEIGKPKRGGPKKFYVYVRKPDGGVKKVTWGDTTGLSVKLNDPEARKSFAARHQCSMQKDRTSAAYWACNTPRYAKQLGLSGGGNFYW